MNIKTINEVIPDQVAQEAQNKKISQLLADACRKKADKAESADISPLMKEYLTTQKSK